jgi:hypothetical protein
MPARARRVVPPAQAGPTTLPPPSHPRDPPAHEEGEYFALDNVPGDDSDDSNEPARRHRGTQAQATATAQDINNPDITTLPKTAAADTRYFFEKVKTPDGEKVVCRECK